MKNPKATLIEMLSCAAALALLVLWSCQAKANGDMPPELKAAPSWVLGEVRIAEVVYCKDRKDAEELATAYAEQGREAADALFAQKNAVNPTQVVSGVCTFQGAIFFVRGLVASKKGPKGEINVIRVEDARAEGSFYYVVNTHTVVTQGRRA